MKRYILVYLAMVAAFGLGVFFLIQHGQHLQPPPKALATSGANIVAAPVTGGASPSIWSGLSRNTKEPLFRFLLQVIVIIIATRAVGAVFAKFNQPIVVGEVLAGILLGPSLLGWLWPSGFSFIFPKESFGALRLFSEVGVCLFMFVVGLELDLTQLRRQARTVVMVSHVSIMFPFLLGMGAALFLFSTYAAPGASFPAFALFMGVVLSITAFPVLARILTERRMTRTALGSTAIASAAVGDAMAWSILAFVVAIARAGGLASTALCLGLVVVFALLMLRGARAFLPKLLGVEEHGEGAPGNGSLVIVLVLLFASASVTELIGIHALFGAFLAGVAMPRKKEFRDYLAVRLENFSSLFLLPLFFAFSGLRTQVGTLNDATSWSVCVAIILLATLGKLGGTAVTARLTGMGWNDSFALGALMNTRGLVELVALNIGYDLGILPPRIFAMMVLMALVTTFLTGPLLNLAERAKRSPVPAALAEV